MLRTPDERVPAVPLAAPAADVAETCRQAFQTFLFGVASGWGKVDLACFLVETYGALAIHAHDEDEDLRSRPFADAHVEPSQVTDLLQATRRDVLEVLDSLTRVDGGKQLTFTAMTSGWVVPARDPHGELGWVPVSKPNMRLRARILSLVAADYLVRREDYLVLLAICARCERAVFDIVVRSRGTCCRATSGIWSPAMDAAKRAEGE